MSCDVGEVRERLENELILQPFFHFSYVTSSSLNSPGQLPMTKYRHVLRMGILTNFKFLQVIYESFECGLTQEFPDLWFQINSYHFFYDDTRTEFYCITNNFWPPLVYVVHLFSWTIYSRGLKFLQVIYESLECGLTQEFPDSWFQINSNNFFYDDTRTEFYWITKISTLTVSFMSAFHGQLTRWIKWRSCDVREAKEGLENELWRRWSNRRVGEWAVM